MPAAVIAQLLAQYGIPLVQQLVAWHAEGKAVTADDFATLVKLGQYRSSDALAAAGIKLVEGKVVPV